MQSTPNKSKNDIEFSVYSCFEKNGWDEVPRCSLHQTRAKMTDSSVYIVALKRMAGMRFQGAVYTKQEQK